MVYPTFSLMIVGFRVAHECLGLYDLTKARLIQNVEMLKNLLVPFF